VKNLCSRILPIYRIWLRRFSGNLLTAFGEGYVLSYEASLYIKG